MSPYQAYARGIQILSEAATEGLASGAKAPEQPNPMIPAVKEIAWGAGTFAVVLVFMVFIGVPRIQRVMDERDKRIRDDLNEAERAELEAESALSVHNSKLRTARVEASRIIDVARHEALSKVASQRAELEQELATAKAAHLASVNKAKLEAETRISSEVDTLAVDLAQAAAGSDINKNAQIAFLSQQPRS